MLALLPSGALPRLVTSPGFRLRAAIAAAALLCCAAGASAQQAPAVPASAAAAEVLVSGPAGRITRADVELAVAELVPAEDRRRFWLSRDAVARMARSLYAQRALAAEAVQAGVENTPEGAATLRMTRERTLTELLMQQRVQAATPDGAALERFARAELKAKPERFQLPEEVRVRHILLATARDGSDDAAVKAKAEALVAELRQGADFATLARARSEDRGSAQRGGDLGLIPRGKMAPEFEEAAFALKKPGELSAPVKTQFGYHVIELVERKPTRTKDFEQVLPEVRDEVRNKINTQERRRIWEAAEASAQVDEAAIGTWVETRPFVDR